MFGAVSMGAGYFLWRRSKKAAILSVMMAVLGEVLVRTYLEVVALAGVFTYVWVLLAVAQVVLTFYGWKRLK
jgi:hypothetical protein